MISGKPLQRMPRIAGQVLPDDSKSVNIGHDTSKSNKSTISATQRRRVGKDPSSKKVSDRAHVSQLDHHIPALNFHRIHGNLSSRRTSLTGLRIPLPSMPRANHLPS